MATLEVPAGAPELSEARVKQVKQAFALFDKDGDSTITQKDLDKFMKGVGNELSELQIEDMIAECNKAAGTLGDDGASNYVEFKAFYTALAPKLTADMDEQNKGAWKMFDKDNTGFVTIDAMKSKLMAMIPGFPESEAEAMFKDAADKDGKISFDFFDKAMKEATELEKGKKE